MTWATREQLTRQRWPVQALVHVGGALAYSVVHTAILMALRAALLSQTGLPKNFPGWWNYTLMQHLTQLDWLLMTYLFLVGLAHALAYRRESEARALNAAQLETRLVEAQLQALQRQLHPHFLFNTLNTISGLIRINAGGGRRDDRPAGRPAADDAAHVDHPGGAAQGRARRPAEVSRDRADPVRQPAARQHAHPARHARRAGAQPAAAAARRKRDPPRHRAATPGPAGSRSTRIEPART